MMNNVSMLYFWHASACRVQTCTCTDSWYHIHISLNRKHRETFKSTYLGEISAANSWELRYITRTRRLVLVLLLSSQVPVFKVNLNLRHSNKHLELKSKRMSTSFQVQLELRIVQITFNIQSTYLWACALILTRITQDPVNMHPSWPPISKTSLFGCRTGFSVISYSQNYTQTGNQRCKYYFQVIPPLLPTGIITAAVEPGILPQYLSKNLMKFGCQCSDLINSTIYCGWMSTNNLSEGSPTQGIRALADDRAVLYTNSIINMNV